MARGVNSVTLIGNVGNDPEMKYTQGGMAICTISLATTSVRKDKDGNQQEQTQWHRVKLFGKLGEIAGEYVKKGRQIYIQGSIRYDKFTGQDGQERYVTEIVADEMQMLGVGDRNEGGGQRSGGRPAANDGGGQRGGERSYGQRGGGSGGGGSGGGRAPAAHQRDNDPFDDGDIPF